ncbi:MAG TPA: hypothetical protein DIV86_02305 [Alphaproteobacteria bacterium]|nr:hypothetical protein [Alphaproteobacteria bacterium]
MNSSKKIYGFSLIEVSLLLVVFSVLAVVALQNITSGYENEKNEQVFKKLKLIRTAILNYVRETGHYPCPANPYLPTTDEFYAKGQRDSEGNCKFVVDCTTATPGGSAPDNVLCYKSNSVDRANLSVNYGIVDADYIMGSVPCEDLGLNRDCLTTNDGQKITYATSTYLSKPSPCVSFVANSGLNTISGAYKLKILKNFNPAVNLASNYASNKMFSSSANEPEFVLIYHGSDGVGSWSKSGIRVEATSVSSGGLINDNLYQQVNHNINSSQQLDEYFLSPARPLDTPDANLTSTNPKIIFGDILLYGKASDTDLPKKICLNCQSCDVGWIDKVEKLDSFTSCASSVPDAATVCN